MTEKRFGALSSVTNPQELSLTVQSFAKLVLALAVSFGWITSTGADTSLEQIPVIVTAGLATWELCNTLWGAARKVIYAVFPPK